MQKGERFLFYSVIKSFHPDTLQCVFYSMNFTLWALEQNRLLDAYFLTQNDLMDVIIGNIYNYNSFSLINKRMVTVYVIMQYFWKGLLKYTNYKFFDVSPIYPIKPSYSQVKVNEFDTCLAKMHTSLIN